MTYPTVYDKAKWHYEGDFPRELPESHAFIHIGFMLGWLIDRGMVSEEFEDDFADEISQFKQRLLTGPQLLEIADGVLASDMLNKQGNDFLHVYYHATTDYLRDVEKVLGKWKPTLYHAKDTWENYNKICRQIEKRFKAWQK